jgi:hypothetical protein
MTAIERETPFNIPHWCKLRRRVAVLFRAKEGSLCPPCGTRKEGRSMDTGGRKRRRRRRLSSPPAPPRLRNAGPVSAGRAPDRR